MKAVHGAIICIIVLTVLMLGDYFAVVGNAGIASSTDGLEHHVAVSFLRQRLSVDHPIDVEDASGCESSVARSRSCPAR